MEDLSTTLAPLLTNNNSSWDAQQRATLAAATGTNTAEKEAPENLCKKYAKIILPHVGLILISFVYIVGGALVFYTIEGPHEKQLRNESLHNISEAKISFLRNLYEAGQTHNETEWKKLARIEADNVTLALFKAFQTQYVDAKRINGLKDDDDNKWTIQAAIFFTATLLTTIGYGNLVPKTFHGRVFCICYGLLGVPLILITVADFGKFLSEHIVWLYRKYRTLRKHMCSRFGKPRTADSSAVNTEVLDPDFALYDYVAIPVSLVLFILIAYITLGALLLSETERWKFFNAFYFSFVTMTTVGFGDLVPENESHLMLDLFYIVVGLAFTTMCIDLVGIQYIRKIHYFGRAIQDARYALVNVGGKMVQVGDLMKYAQFLHRKYGLEEDDTGRIIENPLARLFPNAFIPGDIHYIRYIDYIPGSHESLYNTLQQHLLRQQAKEMATKYALEMPSTIMEESTIANSTVVMDHEMEPLADVDSSSDDGFSD